MHRCIAVVAVLLSVVSLPAAASAEGVEVTPFLGYQLGGDFEQHLGDALEDLDLDEDANYGLILDFPLSRWGQIELLWVRNESQLVAGPFLGGVPGPPLDVEYLHAGGLFQWGLGQLRPFLVLTAGATRFEPEAFGTETRFSVALGGGVKAFVGDHLGFRFEGRAYSTFIDASDELACGRGYCVVFHDSTTFNQIDVKGGVILRF